MKKVFALNRKARHDFFILETLEAGISLTGGEVKSIRQGKISLQESFARIKNGEIFLTNAYIGPFAKADTRDYDPRRARKLLLHKGQINRFLGLLKGSALTIVPLKVYSRRNKIKAELALVKSKKKYGRKEAKKRKDIEREIERALKEIPEKFSK